MKLVPHPASTQNALSLISQALAEYWGDSVPPETAKRILGYWQEFTPPDKLPTNSVTTFRCDCDEMVLVKDIPYQSMCEHHLLPFYGVVHIAYIPNRYVLGLSKFGRITDYFARRPQLQERLTMQIGGTLDQVMSPVGVLVVCEGTHTCMSARGVLKQGAITKTSYVSGAFKDDTKTRQEGLQLIYG